MWGRGTGVIVGAMTSWLGRLLRLLCGGDPGPGVGAGRDLREVEGGGTEREALLN